MNTVTKFENEIASFFGAPHAVAVDCCTHGLELCLRYTNAKEIKPPTHTYLSVAMLADKLNIKRTWREIYWKDYYYLTDDIIDAAVLWEADSYIPGTFMCISFQFQKHLSLGRGGMVLCDDPTEALILKKMSYDGRVPEVPWREQNIYTVGYHYYMTPETADRGLEKLQEAIDTPPRSWVPNDWPDLRTLEVFKNG